MNWKQTKRAIAIDVYRNLGTFSKTLLIQHLLKKNSPVGLLVAYRICHYFALNKSVLKYILHPFFYHTFNRKKMYCGIEIQQRTEIGEGLRLPHCGGIVIHPSTKIGNYCEIMQNVTIGNNILKSRDDVPTIGNKCLICAGAKIIGGVSIGDNVVVGANSVVNKDVDSNIVVAGVPAKQIGVSEGRHLINMTGESIA